MPAKKQLVFVSERNRCRSIIAQAYALKLGSHFIDTQSFGLQPDRVHYLVKEVLEKKGFNMTFYFSKAYQVVKNQKFGIWVSMHPTIREKLPVANYEYRSVAWRFEDPTVKELSENDMRHELETLCEAIENEVRHFVNSLKRQND